MLVVCLIELQEDAILSAEEVMVVVDAVMIWLKNVFDAVVIMIMVKSKMPAPHNIPKIDI